MWGLAFVVFVFGSGVLGTEGMIPMHSRAAIVFLAAGAARLA